MQRYSPISIGIVVLLLLEAGCVWRSYARPDFRRDTMKRLISTFLLGLVGTDEAVLSAR
jgi:hypothetical protein